MTRPDSSNNLTRGSRRTRLLEIVRVMRNHNVITNFINQRNPREVRLAFQELGPTFIKAGQLLSTRPDLISPAFIAEMRQLQDNVEVDDFASVKATFEEQTGKKLSEVFSFFDETPFASASIGQTHRAILKDGTKVVVKIQHPEVARLIATDLALFRLALRMTKFTPDIGAVNPREIFNEIRTSLLNEINTEIEIANGQEFYHYNNNDGIIRVPKVYKQYSAQKVLVNSSMPGKSIKNYLAQPISKDLAVAESQKAERKYLAQVLVNNFLKQVFEDNFFHADPHPGNILFYRLKEGDPNYQENQAKEAFSYEFHGNKVVWAKRQPLPPYRLVYLDFGMMGRLTPSMIDGIAQIVLALNTKDIRQIGQAILAVCNQTGPVDSEDFYEELGLFLTPFMNMGLDQIDFPAMLYSVIGLCRKNNLQMKAEVTLLVKAFGSLEGLVSQLDPDLSMMDVARPLGKAYLKRKFNLKTSLEDLSFDTLQSLKATSQLPTKASKFFDVVSSGQTRFSVRYKGQDKLLDRIDHLANRIIIALVLAAIILASSLLVEGSANHPAIYNLGVTGYIVAIVLVALLVLDDLHKRFKKRKRK
ncbi:2-octaprenylphenol hydroxylase [Ligilactobacillus agilis]|uniref:2-octaprenylphenol hydroxylase n=1 Tax=Ligilactobacillus agilis TaxID=1601 RepID=A0A226RMA7_9LACO|nr:AarF/UbiB family protein [Ligilactobacillus agilis]OXC08413.1 2-octaprenylphenol hydroxylase [Ligilactobacillus agilis]OXC10561.1 2-octaprenylphenol hydroxylase [Ligilactobacillus agilis]OXC11225.1 2-octaprenylphenol hydroxylase [Ligilactobacillus agilis]OXS37995.1 2-octaprenylphenol hydroxylase [Ligilactobacillus agilis]OXS38639.1 2-octaprenylphenol hydroxylase [Ligilactobacillus agilis]